jgi:hypothetical protein
LRSGDTDTLNQIAQAHQQLGLKSREVGSLGGGAEAGAFLNLGKAEGQTSGPNMHVEKFYNPVSNISRGDHTRQMVDQKKQFTDTARNLSPEAKAMMPEHYGNHSNNIASVGGDLQRTRSTHEFVPGMGKSGPLSEEQIDKVEQHVINPMKERGMSLGDTVREGPSMRNPSGPINRHINRGNVVSSPSGPKIVDFLPHTQGKNYLPGESFKKYAPDYNPNDTGPSGEISPAAAKKEFFNPSTSVRPAPQQVQSMAGKLWDKGGIPPDFNVNKTPYNQRSYAPGNQVKATPITSPPVSAPTAVVGRPRQSTNPMPTIASPPPSTSSPTTAMATAASAPTAVVRRPQPMATQPAHAPSTVAVHAPARPLIGSPTTGTRSLLPKKPSFQLHI